MKVKTGQKFYATVRRGPHSLTLEGKETAGRKLGPFVATKVTYYRTVAGSRHFSRDDFSITRS